MVALIRGINVGKAKRVAMPALRAAVEGLGYADVRTVLATGNVVFDGEDDPRTAASRIEAVLPVAARVTVLESRELEAVLEGVPWQDRDPSRIHVGVLGEPSPATAPLIARDWAPEEAVAAGRAVYLWCPDGVGRSPLWAELNRALGNGVTTRTLGTFERIRATL